MDQHILEYPLLPLRDVVVYPYITATLLVGREKSIQALEAAMADDKHILLLAQKEASDDEPEHTDMFEVGTVARILRLLKLPEGPVKLLVEGVERVKVQRIIESDKVDYLSAEVTPLQEAGVEYAHIDSLKESLWEYYDSYVSVESRQISSETRSSLQSIDDLSRLVDAMVTNSGLDLGKKQEVLELLDVVDRIEYFIAAMDLELELLQIEKRIRGRVKKQMEKSQREYYLNEQIKAIQKELGDMDDAPDEMAELKGKIEEAGMPQEVADKAKSELKKLSMMAPSSAEASVLRNYMDWLLKLPWKKKTKIAVNLVKARAILDEDHYGLEDVKDRILQYLAVQKRVKKSHGSVLCLVGPPGVGKTSLGRSIARATGRKFIRMALGGVRDEAEIRGHRRTYIGAMPGKILQKMSKAEVRNPLFLLDEIDKMGMDHRGDPASALLEVLDPEQNKEFGDHYLEVDYDLSDVMYICTSNSMNIPAPLLDRMEVIRLPGYTEEEKYEIAKRHLLPRQMKATGLKASEIELDESVLLDIVRYYTREAGVRNMEREIAKLCRKVVFTLIEKQDQARIDAKKSNAVAKKKAVEKIVVNSENLEEYLGPYRFQIGLAEKENHIGMVTGLAWTQVGGELLSIETALVPGKGRYTTTGSLGDVMQESIKAAMTAVKARSQELGIPADIFEKHDVHVHMPEGATPKDGPSAGIGLAMALISALTKIPVKSSVAMTGEITLRGQVLKIGGLKEKLLAALRGGIKTVIIPQENVRDLQKIPDFVKNKLAIVPVKSIDQIIDLVLEEKPKSLSDEEYALSIRGITADVKGQNSSEYVKPH